MQAAAVMDLCTMALEGKPGPLSVKAVASAWHQATRYVGQAYAKEER